MDFVALYTKTNGRISRKTWWIGALVLSVAGLVVNMIILPIMGLGMPDPLHYANLPNTPAAITTMVVEAIQRSAWASLLVLLIFAWPVYCLSVKRRHDRNNNGIDVAVSLGVAALTTIAHGLGLTFTPVATAGTVMPTPTFLYMLLSLVGVIIAVYLLVVLGFLKGTEGPNSYGKDPLALGFAAQA